MKYEYFIRLLADKELTFIVKSDKSLEVIHNELNCEDFSFIKIGTTVFQKSNIASIDTVRRR